MTTGLAQDGRQARSESALGALGGSWRCLEPPGRCPGAFRRFPPHATTSSAALRDDPDDETRRDQRDEQDDTTLPTKCLRSDGLLKLTRRTLKVMSGHFGAENGLNIALQTRLLRQPRSRGTAGTKIRRRMIEFGSRRQIFEDVFALCQAS